MIRHIVMWKIKAEYNGKEKAVLLSEMKQKLKTLPSEIKEIKRFDIDINIVDSPAHYDIVLISTFDSLVDLNTYQVHEKHRQVVDFVQEIAVSRTVIDAEIE